MIDTMDRACCHHSLQPNQLQHPNQAQWISSSNGPWYYYLFDAHIDNVITCPGYGIKIFAGDAPQKKNKV